MITPLNLENSKVHHLVIWYTGLKNVIKRLQNIFLYNHSVIANNINIVNHKLIELDLEINIINNNIFYSDSIEIKYNIEKAEDNG